MLRAFAVILVIYNHSMLMVLGHGFTQSYQVHFLHLNHWTSIGLDLFFVISGIIMSRVTYSYSLTPNGWFNFLLKRLIRIIPLYWLVSAFVYGQRMAINHPMAPEEILKTILFFPIFGAKNTVFPIVGQGWSLTYELYFYFLIVLLLCIKPKKLLPFLLLILGSMSIIGFFTNPQDHFLQFLFSPILFEFGLGVGIGLMYSHLPEIPTQKRLNKERFFSLMITLFGFILMTSTLFFDCIKISDPSLVTINNVLAFQRSIIWGIPCTIFSLGILLIEKYFFYQIPKIWIRIGDASFSGYLIHILVIAMISKLMQRFGLHFGDLFILLATFSSVWISLPFHDWIETPLLIKLNALIFKKSKNV